MSQPHGRSRLLLLAFFAALFLSVGLLAHRYWGVLRPSHHLELARLARVESGRVDAASILQGVGETAPAAALLERWRQGDWPGVANLLEHTQAVDASAPLLLLQGIAYLKQQRPSPALVSLDRARGQARGAAGRDASWFLAQALLILGRPEDALGQLDPLATSAGPWQREAAEQAGAVRGLLQ